MWWLNKFPFPARALRANVQQAIRLRRPSLLTKAVAVRAIYFKPNNPHPPMFLFFDTETTGLPAKGQYSNPSHPLTPKLVELAACLFDSEGNELESLVHIIKPYGFEISVGASNVHGITTERANKEGVELKPAIETFLDLVEKSSALVAHNALYDKLILDRVMIDLNYEGSFLIDRPLICTKELTTPVCRLPGFRGQFKWPTLQEAHLHFFNSEFASAHSALADVQACARIFFEGRKRKLWV